MQYSENLTCTDITYYIEPNPLCKKKVHFKFSYTLKISLCPRKTIIFSGTDKPIQIQICKENLVSIKGLQVTHSLKDWNVYTIRDEDDYNCLQSFSSVCIWMSKRKSLTALKCYGNGVEWSVSHPVCLSPFIGEKWIKRRWPLMRWSQEISW